MTVIYLAAIFLLIGKTAGYGHGPSSSHQGPAPGPDYIDNIYGHPAPSSSMINVNLYATPSNTVLVGAPVNLTCKFSASIFPLSVSFLIADSLDNPNELTFATSSVKTGVPISISENVVAIVSNSSVSLVFYKTVPSDSGIYQCRIPNVVNSNQLPLTVTDQLPIGAPCFGELTQPRHQIKTTLIVAITVPLVIVLVLIVVILVMRFHYGYQFYGMFQFRRMRKSAASADIEVEKKATFDKLEVLNAAQLPAYDVAVKAASENKYLPPGYDEAVYNIACQPDTDVQVTPSGASWKVNVA